MIAYHDIGTTVKLDEDETYWIPSIPPNQSEKSSFMEIDYLVGGFGLRKKQVDEKLLEKTIAMTKRVLSPTSVMIRIKAGSFLMGNIENDATGHNNEKPVCNIFLTYDFWLGKYPVTFWEYDSFCAATNRERPEDKGMGRGPRPVINVRWWYDAICYCNWLSQREGMARAYDEIGNLLDTEGERTEDVTVVEGYRLPTEAEWEYAARGGHKRSKAFAFSGSDNLNEAGWYDQNSSPNGLGGITHPVGKKKPNELNIYDMSGNVWEWCHDRQRKYLAEPQANPIGAARGSCRIMRGGSFRCSNKLCRIARREAGFPDGKACSLGFRIARTIR